MAERYVALVRHGEYQQLSQAPSAYQPFPLSASGLQQCQAGAEELLALSRQLRCCIVDQIDCSVLLRAWQTAQQLRQWLPGIEQIDEYEALCERSVGSVANLTVAQIEAALRDDPRYPAPPTHWKADSHYRLPYPGAESLLQAGERVAQHLRQAMLQLPETDEPQLKVVVGHGAAFRHAAFHLGVIDFNKIATLSMYYARPVILKFNPGGPWQHVAGDWKHRRGTGDPID